MEVSKMDIDFLKIIRSNIDQFLQRAASHYAIRQGRLLDIAPQIYQGAKAFFPATVSIETLDIDANSGATYVGDICKRNSFLQNSTFDFIVCTEVLEHTLQPFEAITEIWRLLKPGGLVFITVPFNFRIHGPLPDCWRFTEHGLRALLTNFEILELTGFETPGRSLMPIHYTVVAKKTA